MSEIYFPCCGYIRVARQLLIPVGSNETCVSVSVSVRDTESERAMFCMGCSNVIFMQFNVEGIICPFLF